MYSKKILFPALLAFCAQSHAVLTPGMTDLGAIWFIGDSITQSNADKDGAGSPRKSLYDRLNAGGYTFTYTGSHSANTDGLPNDDRYTYHSGYSGTGIGGMQGGLNGHWGSGLLKTVKPNIALIMLGTNDINNNASRPQAASEAATRMENYIKSIYTLAGNDLTVLLSTIPPNKSEPNGATDTINTKIFNDLLPQLVTTLREAGRDVTLVDAFTPLNDDYENAMRTDDNLHPNKVGNGIIAGTWYNEIVGRVSPIPEPSSYFLLGISAFTGIACIRRRMKK